MFQSITDVKNYITKTVAKYSKDFVTQNYTIEYSNRQRRTLATTNTLYLCGKPIRIRFVFNNKYLASYQVNEEDIKNTILHEIAHAIAGGHNHHNEIWKRCACKLGARPERFSNVEY